MTRRPRATAIAIMIGLSLALGFSPPRAVACEIDNTASLFANGVQATPNGGSPSNVSLWAPFAIVKVFASGDVVTLAEAHSDLVRTLTAATLAAPFRWVFGDGSVALGHQVSHRFVHPGTFRLRVYGYSAKMHSWFPFDSALLHIVPPGQVLQANLGYYAMRALDVAMSGVMWLIDAIIILFVAYVLYDRYRSRRRSTIDRPS